ncbi:MAG: YifB family Mg chelatase-like AAA ATPase [Patescibacteria group bacterium]|nr:YifB family Mg chelatase-like AAA ATPase [Patescibacteria group bacterium]
MNHISKLFCAELEGLIPRLVEVEVDIHVGLASFTIVGLADKAVSEAKERVSSALKNSGIKPPNRENRKVTVNLAPADIKKNGSQYDVAIALGYMVASGQLKPFDASKILFLGELALDGSIRSIAGALTICNMAEQLGYDTVFIPAENQSETIYVTGVTIYPIASLREVIAHLEGNIPLPAQEPQPFIPQVGEGVVDISEIKGQYAVKRALTIAAAGGHNMFMTGPPGAGKTMLAQSIVSILPPLSFREAVEVNSIYSAVGLLQNSAKHNNSNKKSFIETRPFRAPHHSASATALIGGGGAHPRPGEISLAHRGILFLDEFPEFHRDVLEALRQPLEKGEIVIARSQGSAIFPARFLLIAASNPCPCGFYGDEEKECTCGAYDIIRYQRKLSGPLMDRIDLHVWVKRVTSDDLHTPRNLKESDEIRAHVARAREKQRSRFESAGVDYTANGELSSTHASELIALTPGAQHTLDHALDTARISARGYFKVRKVAQTIADLDTKQIVDEACVQEAFSYRVREQEEKEI